MLDLSSFFVHRAVSKRVIERTVRSVQVQGHHQYGGAGVGKSVIARTMAEILESQKELLATFFFSRDDPSRNGIKFVVATLAYKITLSVPESRSLITSTIERDPLVFHGPFERQFKKLILEPLQQLSQQGVTYPTIIIIDGLDECLNHDERTILLCAISLAAAQYSAPIKFLITSRPEVPIARAFNATPVEELTTRHSLCETGSMMRKSGRSTRPVIGITFFFFHEPGAH